MSNVHTLVTLGDGDDEPSDHDVSSSSEDEDHNDPDLPAIGEYNDDEFSSLFLQNLARLQDPPFPWDVFVWQNHTGQWIYREISSNDDPYLIHNRKLFRVEHDLLRAAKQVRQITPKGLCQNCALNCQSVRHDGKVQKLCALYTLLCVRCGVKVIYSGWYMPCLVHCDNVKDVKLYLDRAAILHIPGGFVDLYTKTHENSSLHRLLRENLGLSAQLFLDRLKHKKKMSHT